MTRSRSGLSFFIAASLLAGAYSVTAFGAKTANSAKSAKKTEPALSAVGWLKKSQWAHDHLPYEGRELTVTWSGGRSDSAIVALTHFGSYERSEYIAPKSLANRIFLSDPQTSRVYNPATRKLVVTSRREGAAINLPLLLKNYDISVEPKKRYVADLPCQIIDLKPKYAGKPRHTLWVDTKTALTLKQERYHSDGSPSSLTQFTEIRIGQAIPASRFKLSIPSDVKVIREPRRMGSSGIRPAIAKILPSGYILQECRAAAQRDGWHCTYSDGMDMLSLFIFNATSRQPLPAGKSVSIQGNPGILRLQSHQMIASWDANGYRWALIGNLSQGLGLQIARAIANR